MKTAVKAQMATAVAFALSAIFIQEAFAYVTLNGTIPSGTTPVVILQAHKQTGATDTLKFKFSAPTPGPYEFNFCIGPVTNPCGTSNSYVVVVPGGEERLAVVPANIFTNNVLVVSQGTNRALPFAVTME